MICPRPVAGMVAAGQPTRDIAGMDVAAPRDSASVCRSCVADPPVRQAADPQRLALVRAAFRLEWLTVAWMVIEAVVAIGSGLAAGSLVLLAFGLDSVIELMSAGVLIWRLSVELRHGEAFSERAERLAARVGGGLLYALAAYVAVAAAWGVWARPGASFSWAGLVVTALAIPIMRWLARRKLGLADQLGSRALRADAMESIACGWLSVVAVVSLAAEAVLGAWWIEPVGSLAIVWLLVKEGREAWAGEDCGCH